MRPVSLLAVLLLAGCPKATAPEAPAEPASTFPDQPTPGAPAVFTPALPERVELSNGVSVYVVTDDSLPLVSVRLVLPTGAVDDPPGEYGLASLGASMLGEGAGDRSALEQAAALDALAANLGIGAGRESLTLALDVHADRLDEALPLAADALLRPAFDPEDWSRVQDQHLNGLRASLDDNRTVAGIVARRQWWGASHPYGTPGDGTVDTAGAITLDDVKAWHAGRIHAGGASFVVVGDVTPDEAVNALEASFGDWEARAGTDDVLDEPVGRGRRVLVDRPGSTQTVIYVVQGIPGALAAPDERLALDVARTIMGGSFTSRLNRRLREELGYTYGARMSAMRMRDGGMLISGGSIRADATADALNELMALLGAAAREGFTADEVARGRAQLVTDTVDGAETRAGLAGTYLGELADGREPGDLGAWLAALDGVTEAQVEAAAKAMDPNRAMIVLVGDRSVIEEPLAGLGFEAWTLVGPDGVEVEDE